MLKKFGGNKNILVGAALILLTLAGSLLGIYSNPSFIFKQNRDAELGTITKPVGEITEESEIRQTFLCGQDKLMSIELNFGTYERINSCILNVTLSNETENRVIESWKVDSSTVVDNSFYTFTLAQILEDAEGDQLEIEIQSDDGSIGNAVTVLMADDDDGRTLYMNGAKMEADLAMSLNYKSYSLAYDNLIGLAGYIFFVLVIVLLALFKLYRLNIPAKLKKVPGYIEKNWNRILVLFALFAILLVSSIIAESFVSRIIKGSVNSQGSYFNAYRWSLIFAVELALYVIFLYRRNIIRSVEVLFLALILCTGGLFAFTLPVATNISWDDQIHFSNVVKQSYLTNCKYTQTDYDIIDIRYPTTYNMNEAEENLNKMKVLYNDEIVLSFDKDYGIFYSSLGYIPTALTMRVARTVGIPFGYVFVLGKLANLAVYAALCFYGMKRLKWGKMIFAIVALLPTNIFIATNYTYDYWVIGFIMLGMACLIGELQQPDKRLEKRDIAVMFGSLFLGMGPKAIYFPMIFLCLLLNKSKFKTEKQHRQYWLAVFGIAFFVALSFVFPFLFAGKGGNDLRGGTDVNSIEQVKFILFHPLQYTKILLHFFFADYFNIANAAKATSNMAYLGLGSLSSISLILMTIAAFLDRNSMDSRILNRKFRIVVLGCLFITASLIATAMYVSFTPVASDVINGCQHRYLMPMIFIALYCFGSGRVENRMNKRSFNSLMLTAASGVIFYEYWVMCISKYF
ncbi:DUF2142 domain-containing protein [Anaerobium acetethylicum]|uniref:Uncharacterized membrane protein n=1 Tax=Anaerobium acetethylicum TaxID=1619234 RepID=A0A1D3TQ92_9FIRM|nr:DUF2142 domain-containing protein [Anaerobium acetethylicum]SCP95734.1 Uncharacterized membrane protein [Anaerobium acetethylicum]